MDIQLREGLQNEVGFEIPQTIVQQYEIEEDCIELISNTFIHLFIFKILEYEVQANSKDIKRY